MLQMPVQKQFNWGGKESLFGETDFFETSWTVAHQVPLSMGFPRQEFWSGLPCLPSGDLPDSGIQPASPALAGRFFTI